MNYQGNFEKKFVIAVKVENRFNSPSYKMIFYSVYISS